MTPVVVSSEIPLISAPSLLNLLGSYGITYAKNFNRAFSSLLSADFGSGRVASFSNYFSNLYPSKIIIVASPPSSTMRVGPFPSEKVRAFNVHHQYSSNVSFFQAKTLAFPDLAIAAAA